MAAGLPVRPAILEAGYIIDKKPGEWTAERERQRHRERMSGAGCLFVACLSLGFGVYAVSQGGPYYGDGKREVWEQAVEAGVAEIVEVEIEYARGRKVKRQEYRWKKCQ